MKNKRSLSNTLRLPRQQLKASIFLSMAIAVSFSAFILTNLNLLQTGFVELAREAGVAPEAIEALSRSIFVTMAVTVLFALSSVGAGFLLGLTMTARIFGPLVPIRRLIAQYAQGDYKARAHLRKDDEFQDLVQDLNELGAALEERHAPKA